MIATLHVDLAPEDLAKLRKAKQESEVELRRVMSDVLRRLADDPAVCERVLAGLKGHV